MSKALDELEKSVKEGIWKSNPPTLPKKEWEKEAIMRLTYIDVPKKYHAGFIDFISKLLKEEREESSFGALNRFIGRTLPYWLRRLARYLELHIIR